MDFHILGISTQVSLRPLGFFFDGVALQHTPESLQDLARLVRSSLLEDLREGLRAFCQERAVQEDKAGAAEPKQSDCAAGR